MSTSEMEKRPITCPYCDSADTELFSLFGNSLLSSQYVCHACHTVFEVVRFDEEESNHYSVSGNQSEESL